MRRRRSIPTLSSIAAYEQWAANYPPHAHNPLMQTEQRAVEAVLPSLGDLTVLDLACGSGRYGRLAQQQGAAQVIGLDNSPAMLGAATIADIALATAEAIPLAANTIDVIICGLALGHLPRLQPTFEEIARVLQPGGMAIISDFHPALFLSGARRTFTGTDGRTYAVEHYPHSPQAYANAATNVGLELTQQTEPEYDSRAVVVVYVFTNVLLPHD